MRFKSNHKPAKHRGSLWLAGLLGLIFIINLLACGGGFGLPSPTRKTVKPADVVGLWTYNPEAGVSVELTLNPDGSYVQNVTFSNTVKRASGKWEIRGSDIAFDAVYTAFDGWLKPEPEVWIMIDSPRPSSGLAVFGGAKDPDLWMEMTWSALPSSTPASPTP